MTSPKRFSEAEVAEILDRATREGEPDFAVPAPGGLTLSELKDIGREVGLRPADISSAAAALTRRRDWSSPLASLRERGASIHVVDLGEVLSEDEWDRFVVSLRETFGVPGTVDRSGTLLTWRGAGVEVHCEPSEAGYRIRMLATNPGAVQHVINGSATLMSGLAMFAGVALLGAGDPFLLSVSGLLAAGGAVWASVGQRVLGRWRGVTSTQFASLEHRVLASDDRSSRPGTT